MKSIAFQEYSFAKHALAAVLLICICSLNNYSDARANTNANEKMGMQITLAALNTNLYAKIAADPPLFYLAENGITIMCPDANVGDTGEVNGIIYTKRDANGLSALKLENENNPEFATTCTTGITDMSDLFSNTASFNQDIGSWDVSSVTNMNSMFRSADIFNHSIVSWDVSSVTSMSDMFRFAFAFNHDIGSWDVSSVIDMSRMFGRADAFNQDLSCWEVTAILSSPPNFGVPEPIWGTRGNCEWTGGTNGDLNTGANWRGGVVPPANRPMILGDAPLVLSQSTDFQNEVRVRIGESLVVGSDTPVLFSGGIIGDVVFERDISEHSRWVSFTSPVANSTIAGTGGLLESMWTQGFPGSDDPGSTGSFANVLMYDETASGSNDDRFIAPSSNIIEPGRGYFLYAYERKDRDDPATALDFPHTAATQGQENSVAEAFSFPITYTPDAGNGWNMLGNPYGASLNWADENWTKTGIDDFAYIWNPATSNYQVTAGGDTGSGNVEGITAADFIAPFQAFFVKANASNPALTVPPSARATQSGNGGLFREHPAAVFTLKLEAGDSESYTGFRFGEGFSREFQQTDAYFLSPMASSFAYTYSIKANNATMLNSLPVDMEEAVDFPIAAGAFMEYQFYDGDATFSWPTFENIPADWTITLSDTHTGAIIDLREESSYSFRMSAAGLKQEFAELKSFRDLQKAASPVMNPMFAGQRFVLSISPGTTTDIPADEQLPQSFALGQNYPNPFNPTTKIRYDLPETAEVRLDVFNIQGQHVANLVNESRPAGRHTATFDASTLASGVYLYRLQLVNSGENDARVSTLTRKMTLVK